jgi:hypothetical protein
MILNDNYSIKLGVIVGTLTELGYKQHSDMKKNEKFAANSSKSL